MFNLPVHSWYHMFRILNMQGKTINEVIYDTSIADYEITADEKLFWIRTKVWKGEEKFYHLYVYDSDGDEVKSIEIAHEQEVIVDYQGKKYSFFVPEPLFIW